MRSIKDIFRSYAVFDAEGRHTNGTDKESNHHYGDAYELLFKDRADVKLMMEVGIADGSSLLAWREVFPNALCVGLDIHQSSKAHGDRIEFHLGDQRSQANCEMAAANRKFDFICDDATHLLEDTLRTFLYLWPSVAPGGVYVVEEFPNIGGLWRNVCAMWPGVALIDTAGPFGGVEPLVAFRKSYGR